MEPYYDSDGITIYHGDCRDVLATLPRSAAQCCITSPPYWGLRDYGAESQIGLEQSPDDYVAELVDVFRKVRDVLCDEGTLWLNIGDCWNAYNGGAGPSSSISSGAQTKERPQLPTGYGLRDKSRKPKDLIGVPWMLAFALRADGWYLRQDIIWHKPNPMPESVRDRCTKAHEYIFLFAKSRRYHFDQDAIREPATYAGTQRGDGVRYANGRATRPPGQASDKGDNGHSGLSHCLEYDTRNKRSVWTVRPATANAKHFAVFPDELIDPCVKAGCPPGGVVIDPFMGSGTTAAVAHRNGCRFIGCEVNEQYAKLAVGRFVDANGYRQRQLLS